VRLLTRTTRLVRVTEVGARYVEDCRRILAEADEADEAASGQHSAPRGRLTLTAPVLFGARYVTPVVAEYLARYPEVTASCWFLDRIVNLMDEGADAAIRIGELPDSSMQAVRVGRVRRMVVGSPDYLATNAPPEHPEDLQRHSVISASPVTPTSDWRWMRDGQPFIVRLQPRMLTTSNDSAVAAAVAGLGLTRVMSYQVADELRDGRLQAVLSDYESAALPVHVVHREGRHATLKVRAFLDLAIERLRANPALT
jgi:DNA-binding transcriptional LysR family regulator